MIHTEVVTTADEMDRTGYTRLWSIGVCFGSFWILEEDLPFQVKRWILQSSAMFGSNSMHSPA